MADWMKAKACEELENTLAVLTAIQSEQFMSRVVDCAHLICDAFKSGKKLLLAGNGGSAADAQHMAGEFVSRFQYDRPGLSALALTVDSSIITAIGNDYGYGKVFERQVQALGKPGDVLWTYSTSGKSPNVLQAMTTARKIGLKVIGFTGRRGWTDPQICDVSIEIPSEVTPKIQEAHLFVGHTICGLVESEMFPQK